MGNYSEDGYALVEGLVTPEIASAFLQVLKQDMGDAPVPLSSVREHVNLLHRPAFEAYGHFYKPLLFFLWGLTPIIRETLGLDLLPTYDYLRIYRQGDVCRVHCDRYSCEHSLSLTLGYSDDLPWDLQIAKEARDPSARVSEDFGEEDYTSLPMKVGDAVLYRGVTHRHGRVKPNPNAWSAHLFLHWVERDGPYRDHAFDGQIKPGPVNFEFV